MYKKTQAKKVSKIRNEPKGPDNFYIPAPLTADRELKAFISSTPGLDVLNKNHVRDAELIHSWLRHHVVAETYVQLRKMMLTESMYE